MIDDKDKRIFEGMRWGDMTIADDIPLFRLNFFEILMPFRFLADGNVPNNYQLNS